MKSLYATLLTGTALLLAGAAQAQKGGNHHPNQFTSLHPAQATVNTRGGGAPPNDDCSGATVQSVNIGTDLVITGDNTGGTDAEGFGFATTWEAILLPACANLQISYCGTNPVFGNFALGIGDCPITTVISPATGDCGDGNILLTYAEVPAGTWYIPVLVDTSATGPYMITVTSSACASAPANDECAGAIVLNSTTACLPTPFFTSGATETLPAIECDGFTSPAANDVWFSFVATSVDQTIAAQGFNESDPFVELFSGTCGALVSLACQDTTFPQSAGENTIEQLLYSGLTPGQTYYVRVYDYGHFSVDHSFEICVTEGLGGDIGINEATAADWSIFPNPGSGVFNMQYIGANGRGTIEVFDVAGRSVHMQQAQLNNGAVHAIDLSGVAAGNYNVRLTVDGVRSERRLMVK